MKLFLLFLGVLPSIFYCQVTDNIGAKDWEDFLSKFPTQKIEALTWVPSVDNVNDTIRPMVINKFLWKEETKPLTIYSKEGNFQYPIGR